MNRQRIENILTQNIQCLQKLYDCNDWYLIYGRLNWKNKDVLIFLTIHFRQFNLLALNFIFNNLLIWSSWESSYEVVHELICANLL